MEKDYIHKAYPKQFKRDEFWAQIKRTINGAPVSENEINLIVKQILTQLDIKKEDNILDLGCGNAALVSRIFESISKYKGVDFSEYLIEIANEYFRPNKSIQYLESDIRSYVIEESTPNIYNKVLCYGAMTYLSSNDFIAMVQTLKDRFKNIERVYFGNIPEKSKAKEFFSKRNINDYSLDDPQSPIGVWWDSSDITAAMENIGFTPIISRMPESFYTSAYRFDLTLVAN